MQSILMPIDFSDATEAVAQYAVEWFPKLDAEVCVLHVSGADLNDPLQGRAVLGPKAAAVVDRLTEVGCKASPKLVFGPTIPSILDQIDVIHPSMVVVGSHGHSVVRDLIVGSVTQSLLHSATCPVLVVPVLRAARKPATTTPDGVDWSEFGYPMI